MRIAQVAPLFESVPPRLYGGTERIVHYLTEELVREGHEVTLFASADSRTSAKLSGMRSSAIRLEEGPVDSLAAHMAMIEQVTQRRREFDVIHFHTGYLHFSVARCMRLRALTTLHGRLDFADLRPIFAEFSDIPLAAISEAQRAPLPGANFIGTVHHGLPTDLLPYNPEPEGYFAFVGRFSPEKRADRAIAIATTLGVPIKLAAKIDRGDRAYFEERISPLLDHPLVEFVGEIGENDKAAFIGNARALLFPIDWPEPFGLVMIESMACGTPVIAFRMGAVPEVIENGVTGFVVTTMQEAILAARRVSELSRARIRKTFELRFSARRMMLDYLGLYSKVAGVQPSAIVHDRIPAA